MLCCFGVVINDDDDDDDIDDDGGGGNDAITIITLIIDTSLVIGADLCLLAISNEPVGVIVLNSALLTVTAWPAVTSQGAHHQRTLSFQYHIMLIGEFKNLLTCLGFYLTVSRNGREWKHFVNSGTGLF